MKRPRVVKTITCKEENILIPPETYSIITRIRTSYLLLHQYCNSKRGFCSPNLFWIVRDRDLTALISNWILFYSILRWFLSLGWRFSLYYDFNGQCPRPILSKNYLISGTSLSLCPEISSLNYIFLMLFNHFNRNYTNRS